MSHKGIQRLLHRMSPPPCKKKVNRAKCKKVKYSIYKKKWGALYNLRPHPAIYIDFAQPSLILSSNLQIPITSPLIDPRSDSESPIHSQPPSSYPPPLPMLASSSCSQHAQRCSSPSPFPCRACTPNPTVRLFPGLRRPLGQHPRHSSLWRPWWRREHA